MLKLLLQERKAVFLLENVLHINISLIQQMNVNVLRKLVVMLCLEEYLVHLQLAEPLVMLK